MLQNKIYQNFFIEIFRTFLTIVFGLSIIALTVRSVNFLDLIVDSGYPLLIYFQYSFLNLFGLAPKFIPLAFLLSIIIFILKHINDREFDVLWVSGVKKIEIVNLFFFASVFIVLIYLIFSIFLTPSALNHSRQLLNKDNLNSFLPTIRSKQFSDSFKGFTYIVEKKINNEVQNIFLHDKGGNLKNLTSSNSDISEITIIAKEGIVRDREMFLINGNIISSRKNNTENEMLKFEQLNINLDNFVTSTVKKPKLQETSTIKLMSCFFNSNQNLSICKDEAKKEILPLLMRRIVLPFYIPVVSLICSLLLLKNQKNYKKKISIFLLSFVVLILTELIIRYTGLNYFLRISYIVAPLIMLPSLYSLLVYKFNTETKIV
ncbi:LptF/LptG family permease [Pelagibacteraceae bacterium]|jgi:lipopolysaccharide export system permease protein|nr:LptF/LptG family permease [Pelagibacteraceae bacterium]